MLRRTEGRELSDSWARRRDRVSRQIELATMRHLIANGIHKVTMEDAAKAAGVSRRTYYRYFPSPIAVVGELPRRGLYRVAAKFRAQPQRLSLVEAYQAAIVPDNPSDDEIEIARLSAEFMRRWPDVWHNAAQEQQATAIRLFTEIIHERMVTAGNDPAMAGAIAAAFNAVTVQIYSAHGVTGTFPAPSSYGDALRKVGRALCK